MRGPFLQVTSLSAIVGCTLPARPHCPRGNMNGMIGYGSFFIRGVSISESREAVPQIIPRFVARYHWHAGYRNSLQPGLSLASSSLHRISRLVSRRQCPRASLHRSPPVNLCLSHLASLQGQAPSHLASHQVRRLANQVRCLRLSRVPCRRCSRLVSRVPRRQASLRHSLQVSHQASQAPSHPASHPHLHRLSRLVSRR